MEETVRVSGLSKTYRAERRRPGRFGWLRSFLTPEYVDIQALEDLSFEVLPGEIVGLLGPNGAGKSTTIKILAGIILPTGGGVSVLGRDPHKQRIENAREIGAVFGQRSHLIFDLPPIDSFGLLRHVYAIGKDDYDRQMALLTSLLGLDDLLLQSVRTLSLGQRMRCEIAAAFLHRPRLVYLDEPTIGLDIEAKHAIGRFLTEISHEQNTTVILSTHDLSDVERVCPRVVLIDKGRLAFDGDLGYLLEHHARERSIQVDLPSSGADELISGLRRDWPGLRYEQFEGRFVVSRVPDRDAVTEVTRVLLSTDGVRNLRVAEPRLEDVIVNAFRSGFPDG
ncbi:MAG: ATP-binding cassette domain-containing protein [Chloroflexi bacterium]|nr:ATP-binding cassette domain-containing protein [Chloroflexota bacterium]MCY3939378.1 ATP-binding cassette domain-containing protein [Chloroflexota bacterium]